MNMFTSLLSPKVLRLVCVLVTAIGFTSCKSPSASSPYASSDAGGYNPYPGSGGQNGSLLAQNNRGQYAEAPPPPPPGYDGPNSGFQSQPSRRSSSSGSGTSKSKSSYASSNGGSSSKKKSSGTSSSAGKKASDGYVFSGGSVHTVRAGDTLYSIAEHNHTTVAKLKSLNRLKSGVLKVGQKIKVR